jgi:hypothetical protein
VFALERWQPGTEDLQFLNVGTGANLPICKLGEEVASVTDFAGNISWDPSKLDGMPKTIIC